MSMAETPAAYRYLLLYCWKCSIASMYIPMRRGLVMGMIAL
jgi:hypothetical protein